MSAIANSIRLMLAQPLAKLPAFRGAARRQIQQALGGADAVGAPVHPSGVQAAHGKGEAVALRRRSGFPPARGSRAGSPRNARRRGPAAISMRPPRP